MRHLTNSGISRCCWRLASSESIGGLNSLRIVRGGCNLQNYLGSWPLLVKLREHPIYTFFICTREAGASKWREPLQISTLFIRIERQERLSHPSALDSLLVSLGL
jgi:hypothetical protein